MSAANPAFSQRIAYVPAIYWRQAEMLALDGHQHEHDVLAPLITLKPPGFLDPPDRGPEVGTEFVGQRYADAASERSPTRYVDRVASQVATVAFGRDRFETKRSLPFVYVDTAEADERAGTTLIGVFVEACDGPVVPVWRSRSPLTHLDATFAAASNGSGIAARVVLGDLVNSNTLPARLKRNAKMVDFILDLGFVGPDMVVPPRQPSWIDVFLRAIDAAEWRRVVLLAGGFPIDIKRHDTFTIPRTCKRVHDGFAAHTRRSFVRGDYGCVHPVLPEGYGGSHNPNLRYATETSWVVHRAHPAPAPLPSPYYALSRACVAHPSFQSRQFSVGDESIFATAEYGAKPGWAKSGLARSLSHHFTVAVVEDLFRAI